MNKLKKILAGLAAVSCILTSVSCSAGNGKKKNDPATPQTADKVMEKAYSAVEIGGDAPFEYINSLSRIGDTENILISGSDSENKSKLYLTDKEFLTFEEIPFEVSIGDNAESYFRTAVAGNGTIFVLATITDYGDAELPDYDDPDFDYDSFDFEALQEATVITQKLYTIDTTGNILSENEIKGLEKYSDDDNKNVYINDFYTIGEDKALISLNNMNGMTHLVLNADGTVSEPIEMGDDGGWFYASGNDSNGNFVFVTYEGDNNVIKTLDSSTLKVLPDTISLKDYDSNLRALMAGQGDYTIFLSSSTALLGVKADGTIEEVVNWIDSDLTGDYIENVIPIGNEEFVIFERNWSNGGTSFYQLTKRDVSELENTQIINMVTAYSDNQILEQVKEFNKTNTDFRIKVEDYNKYYEWDEEKGETLNTPQSQLKQDIAAGKSVDIICMNNGSLLTNLSNKGALVNLYDYMGKNGTVSKDDIIPPLLTTGELNGKLTSISPSCYIDTLACKKKYFDKENWTIDDMISTYENLPDGMKLFNQTNTKDNVFSTFIYGSSSFIDYAKGTCSFDSPEFIKILEFCNTFDNEGEGEEINWETATQEEMDNYWQESEMACRNDKALLKGVYFSDMRAYARALTADFGDDITLVGYPSSDGQGARLTTNLSFGIMANSSNPEACWNFISSFFTEEYQTSDNFYQIPALKTAFGKKLDDAMKKPYYTDQDGKKVEYEDTYYLGEKEMKIPPLTQAQRDYLEEYILGIKAGSYYYDEEVYNIINEEVQTFFKGEKTAQETASVIQNRVSILVSEQS